MSEPAKSPENATRNDPAASSKPPNPHVRRAVIIGIIVAVVGLSIWAWEDLLEDRVIPKRWGTVVSGCIYRSARLHPALVARTLRKYDIDLIIDVSRVEPDNVGQQAEIAAARELGIERLHVPIQGKGEGDTEQFAKALAAMVQAVQQGQTVWIHCVAGVQRTGLLTAYYRMFIEKKSPAEAYREMRRYRWNPADDAHVLGSANRNMAELARLLKEKGVLEAIPDPLPQFEIAP